MLWQWAGEPLPDDDCAVAERLRADLDGALGEALARRALLDPRARSPRTASRGSTGCSHGAASRAARRLAAGPVAAVLRLDVAALTGRLGLGVRSRGPGPPVPAAARHAASRCALYDTASGGLRAARRRADGPHVRLRHHAVRRDAPRATRRPTSRSTWCSGSGATPATTCTTCRTSPTSTTRCSNAPRRPARTGRPGRARDRAVPRRTWPRCGYSRRTSTSARSSRSRESSHAVGGCAPTGDGYDVDGDSTSPCPPPPGFGAVSRLDREQMLELFAERGGDPDRPGKRTRSTALLWRAARPGEPSWDAPLGAGRPGWHIECTRRSRCDHLGMGFDVQGGGTDLVFPHHEMSAAHAEALTGDCAVRAALRARRDGRARRREDEQVPGQPGLRLAAARRPASTRWRSGSRCCDGHYRADREWTGGRLPAAEARLARWRAAAALPTGPPPSAARRGPGRARHDLDTPRALAAVDAWGRPPTAEGGSDAARRAWSVTWPTPCSASRSEDFRVVRPKRGHDVLLGGQTRV